MVKERIKIIHVVEAFNSGIIEFIRKLITDKRFQHLVIHGIRDNFSDYPKECYAEHVSLIPWTNAQREINLVKDLRAYLELAKYLKENINQNSVVHLHSTKAGILGRWYCYRMGIRNRVIFTPNGASFARRDISGRKAILFQYIERLASKLSGIVVCVSKSEAKLYTEIKVSASYINNGTDIVEKYRKPLEEFKKNKFKIITVGRICEQKFPRTFNSIAQEFENRPDVEFVWVGDGDQRNELLSKNIRITGWLDKESVFSEFQSSDIYLSTAQWEGLPFSVIEAMSCGLPLLLSKCVGNIDLVDESNGFLFEGDKEAIRLISLLKDRSNQLSKLREGSKNKVIKEFNTVDMLEAYHTLYTGANKTEGTLETGQYLS
jgi:glycosyltransferase involved in cell wall biosynthesis